MIEVRDLSVEYGARLNQSHGSQEPLSETVAALRDVTLHVAAGEFLLVTGPSGCGKSTLTRVLAGLIPHAITAQMRGQVCIDGIETQTQTLPDLARHVGIVLQNPSAQLFHLTVDQEVAFGPRNLGLAEKQVQQRVEWALAVTGLTSLRQRRPADLSGGEQQRVAIAAVLAMKPRVLILDEPTASLDRRGTRMVLATLRRLNRRQGMTIVLVEHRLAAAMPVAHRLLVMDQGQVVAEGTPQRLLQDRHLREVYGLRRPAATAKAPGGWRNLLTRQRSDHGTGEPLLQLQEVAAGYGRERVLHDIDLTIQPGEFAAIVGRNGAGKSTLARVIAGLLRPAKGRVCFYGSDRSRPGRPRPGQDVSLLFQNPLDQIFTDSVDDELSFGPHNFGRFDAQFHDSLLWQADLRALRRRCPTHLSVGQQQRCVLAACLALQPRLLILDEPTLGQDWAHLQQLMDFVQTLNEQGIAILLISHDYKLVYRYARRVLLLDEGRIVLDGTPKVQGTPVPERGIS